MLDSSTAHDQVVDEHENGDDKNDVNQISTDLTQEPK